MRTTRRTALRVLAGAVPAVDHWLRGSRSLAASVQSAPRRIAAGPFQATWESLASQYKCPDWFRDLKFGVWAHWSAQCVPEQGDWYARQMYIQGHSQNLYHVKTYGHPSTFGFMEIDRLWKAERWNPEYLIGLYKRAGARYFFALANHHDNFDNFDSKHHAWNSVNIGPKKDIIGTWSKVVRDSGLRFGVTNHSAHSWHWFQTAYGYDPEGPLAGTRYDAYTLTKADGRGKWWDGCDPAELYGGGRNLVMPEGMTTIAASNAWHRTNDAVWNEAAPPGNQAFVDRWFLRCQDLMDRYEPDIVYFDNTELPLGQAGLDATAHFYNASVKRRGHVDVVVTGKKMTEAHRAAVVEDIERGVAMDIRPAAWQTDTCLGNWHYQRSLFDEHRYKTAKQVIQMLVDVVSKNGNLMLSVPVRGDGTIDEDEVAIMQDIEAWMPAHAEGIFATRPWTTYGEGPSTASPAPAGQFGGARDVRPYTADDVRFTRKRDTLYAFFMDWPVAPAVITSLATGKAPGSVARVELLGHGTVAFTQGADGLRVTFPAAKIGNHAHALKISGLKLS
jgi:alpha-L-fucosidase